MLTRRLSLTTTMLLTTLFAFAPACDDGGDGDTGASDDTGTTGNTTGNTSGNTSGNTTGNTDDGSDACDGACEGLMSSCGLPVDDCLAICTSGACGECLASSTTCGQDCVSACAGGGDGDGDTGDGDGDGGTGDGDGDTGNPEVPDKDCVINNDCGLSYECVSCGLTDGEGWCVQTMECSFDEDCGFGGKCGYNVETADYRCLPASYCP